MRSHPPSLITLTRALAREHALLPKGSRVLVAVSGGPDSMALLHVLARLRTDLGFTLVAHGVDHGLRAEAGAELELAESLATSLDVPFARTRVTLERGGNLQARARAVRYRALESAARESRCDRIATAHHADDRAETVIMRLMRGAGPRGLAVLPPLAPASNGASARIRPFSSARRRDIEAHVARHGIAFASDPSNRDPRHLRVRVRLELMPVLERMSPSIVAHLCALADQLADLALTPHAHDAGPPLPRATQLALAALASGKTPRARIALPGGLVAYGPRAQVEETRQKRR